MIEPPPPGEEPRNDLPYEVFPMEIVFNSEDPAFNNYSKVIGPEGGVFHFPWGHLAFPPGALNEELIIRVNSEFIFWDSMINVYFFNPHGTDFNVPVELEIRYFNLDEINPDRVFLSYYDEEREKWVIAGHMDHHPETHCFRGFIEHFSRYSLSTNQRPIEQQLEQP